MQEEVLHGEGSVKDDAGVSSCSLKTRWKDIEEGISGSFLVRRKKVDKIQSYIREVTEKYGV